MLSTIQSKLYNYCVRAISTSLVALLSLFFVATKPIQAQTPPIKPPGIIIVNAASMQELSGLAPGSLVTIFGQFQTTNNTAHTPTSTIAPETLGGISVKIGAINASLLYVSPTQINLFVPETVKDLPTNDYPYTQLLTVSDAGKNNFTRLVQISNTAMGIFAVQSNGQGTAVGQITNGVNAPTNIYNTDGSPKELTVTTDGRQNYLTLYGTGLHNIFAENPKDENGVAEAYTATIQGIEADLTYAGPQGTYLGVDQINLKIPAQAAGLGVVNVRIGPKGLSSFLYVQTNPVTIKMGGTQPQIISLPIPDSFLPFDATGELTRHSQVMKAINGKVYFYDAWRYHATQKGMSLVLRSSISNPIVLVYKVNADKVLQYVAASVTSYPSSGGLIVFGSYSTYQILLTALPEAGDYLLLVTSNDDSPEATGQYQFTLNTNVPEIDLSRSSAQQQGKFDSTDLSLANNARIDGYWFAGKQGGKLNLSATAGFQIVFGVVKADGTSLGSGINGNTLSLTLPETGNYIVYAWPLSALQFGEYTLNFSRPISSPLETQASEAEFSQQRFRANQTRIERLGTRRFVDDQAQ